MTDKQIDLNYYSIPIDLIPLNVVIYRYENDDFIFVDVNKEAQKTEKIEKKDLLGKKLCNIFTGVKAFGLFDALLRVHEQGGTESFEKAFYKDNRISGWRKNKIFKLPCGDLMVIYEDLTPIKQLEEESKNYQKHLEEAQQIAHLGSWSWDLETNQIEWSDEVFRIFGEEPQSFVPTFDRFASYLGNQEKIQMQELIRKSIEHKKPYNFEHSIRLNSGEIRYARESANAIFNEMNEMTGMVGTVLDISSYKKIANKLQLLGAILDNTMNEVFIFDAHTLLFSYANQAAQENIGYSLDELLTMTPVHLKPKYTLENFLPLLEPLYKREQNSLRFGTLHRRKDGTNYYVEIHLQYIEVENKKQFVVIAHDIAQQKIAQDALEESEKKYRNLVEKSMIGIYRTDLLGNILYLNQALTQMLGFDSPDELIGKKSLLRYKNPLQRETLVAKLLQEGFVSNYEVELLDKNQNVVPVMLSAMIDGNILSGMIIDMSELNKSRKELDKLSTVVEQINDSVLITDRSGKITYVNKAFCDYLGYTKEEVLGKYPSIFKSNMHDHTFYATLWRTILNGEVFRGTIVNLKKNGELYYEDKNITPLKDDKNNIISFVSSGKDVTKETLLRQEIERMATIDKLTGLYNRHKFEELFALEAERFHRFALPLSIILIDIDHFKLVNDTYGHDVGDEVLKRLSRTVQKNIRKIDILARWGGEEFLVLCPGTDLKQTKKLAKKLCEAVEHTLFDKVAHVTISLGVSSYEEHDTFSKLFKRTDKGLYYAKEHGRNRVGVYTGTES